MFGSVARMEERPESDVALLVELEPGRTLFDLAAHEERLEALLGRPVQVATAHDLRVAYQRPARVALGGAPPIR